MRLIAKPLAGFTLMLLFVILSIGAAPAEEMSYSVDYPGLKQRGGAVDLADSQVRSAVRAFQLVYGRNPVKWSEVTDSGLFDNELYGYQLESIDPDDASIDFQGDLYLKPAAQTAKGNSLALYNYWNKHMQDDGRHAIEIGSSYTDRLKESDESEGLSAAQLRTVEAWLANEKQLIQFGHVRQLTEAVLVYQSVYGAYPETLTDMVNAGIGPLRAGAVNPVTGSAYKFDGSKGDILYRTIDNGMGFKLDHVDISIDPDFQVSY